MGQGEGQLAHGVADGIDGIADAQLVGIADGDGLQILGIDLENGDVGGLIIADDLGVVGLAVIGGDGDGVGAADHMAVGENVAVVRDDEAGAGGLVGVAVAVTAVDLTGGGDADDRADILLIEIGRGERGGFIEHGLRGKRGLVSGLGRGTGTAADDETACEQAGKEKERQGLLKNGTGNDRRCFHAWTTSFRF